MADSNRQLIEKFKPQNRYSNFGPFLINLTITGFRGLRNVAVKFKHPITAISGLNGAGKSTIGQLAVCAYKKPSTTTEYKRQYIKDFFPISPADPQPIDDDPSLLYQYATDSLERLKDVTITRASSAWSGYKRQPERCCYYIGFTVYIPKVERRDLSVYSGKSIELTSKRIIDQDVQDKVARIIGQKYEEIAFQGFQLKLRQAEIGIASKYGSSYSENNMGFGEGRVLYIVDKLENAPEQSLFVLEEPETSLHENAQYELSKYLLDVSNRRHHQIIASTHSSIFLSALPPESRKLLIRDDKGVIIHGGISANQVRSILSDGHSKCLDICVEDDFAEKLLIEAIRKQDKNILKSIAIHQIGDKKAVGKAVNVLRETGKNAIAVRDPDVGEDITNKLYSFPGNFPPEKEVFDNEQVRGYLNEKYDIDLDWLKTKTQTTDHHQLSKIVATEVLSKPDIIAIFVIEEFLKEKQGSFTILINHIKGNI